MTECIQAPGDVLRQITRGKLMEGNTMQTTGVEKKMPVPTVESNGLKDFSSFNDEERFVLMPIQHSEMPNSKSVGVS